MIRCAVAPITHCQHPQQHSWTKGSVATQAEGQLRQGPWKKYITSSTLWMEYLLLAASRVTTRIYSVANLKMYNTSARTFPMHSVSSTSCPAIWGLCRIDENNEPPKKMLELSRYVNSSAIWSLSRWIITWEAARKKSCDRQVPSCGSCKSRGEVCIGYGILLSWPKEPGSRRAFFCVPKVQLPIHGRPLYFIDLGNRDIELAVRLRDPNWSSKPEKLTCEAAIFGKLMLNRNLSKPFRSRGDSTTFTRNSVISSFEPICIFDFRRYVASASLHTYNDILILNHVRRRRICNRTNDIWG